MFRRSKFFDFLTFLRHCSGTQANSSKNFPSVDIWTLKHTTIPVQHPHVYIYCYEISSIAQFVSLVVLTILITNIIATSMLSMLSGFESSGHEVCLCPARTSKMLRMAVWFPSTECPSTDVCPSPSGPNTVAYCSLREPGCLPTESNIQEKQEVAIATDKESYQEDPGEPVKIIIQNVGNQPLRVSGLNYNLTIINLANNQSFPLVHGKTSILAVDSGASANASSGISSMIKENK